MLLLLRRDKTYTRGKRRVLKPGNFDGRHIFTTRRRKASLTTIFNFGATHGLLLSTCMKKITLPPENL